MKLLPGMKVMRLAGHLGGYCDAVILDKLLEMSDGHEKWSTISAGLNLDREVYILPGSLVNNGKGVWFPWWVDRS